MVSPATSTGPGRGRRWWWWLLLLAGACARLPDPAAGPPTAVTAPAPDPAALAKLQERQLRQLAAQQEKGGFVDVFEKWRLIQQLALYYNGAGRYRDTIALGDRYLEAYGGDYSRFQLDYERHYARRDMGGHVTTMMQHARTMLHGALSQAHRALNQLDEARQFELRTRELEPEWVEPDAGADALPGQPFSLGRARELHEQYWHQVLAGESDAAAGTRLDLERLYGINWRADLRGRDLLAGPGPADPLFRELYLEAYRDLAEMYLQENDLHRAHQCAQRHHEGMRRMLDEQDSLQVWAGPGGRPGQEPLLGWQSTLAECRLRMDRPLEALPLVQAMEHDLAAYDRHLAWLPRAWRLTRLAAAVYAANDEPGTALRLYQRAAQQFEGDRTPLAGARDRWRQHEGHHILYAPWLRLLVREGRDDEAFAVSERARARALLDTLRGFHPVPADAAAQRLLAEHERLAGSITRTVVGPPERDDARRQSLAIKQAKQEQIAATIQRAFPGLAGLLGIHTLPRVELQALIPPGTLVLDYYVAGPDMAVFLLTASRFHTRTITMDRATLAEQIADCRRRWESGATDNPAAVGLYHALIAPFHLYIADATQLCIVPHGPLADLPFAALTDGTHCLVERVPCRYLPTVNSLRYDPAAPQPAAARIIDPATLGIGPASGGTRFDAATNVLSMTLAADLVAPLDPPPAGSDTADLAGPALFQQVFRYAGVPATLARLWPPAADGVDITGRFVQQLVQTNAVQALADVQRAGIAAGQPPRAWAAPVLYGHTP